LRVTPHPSLSPVGRGLKVRGEIPLPSGERIKGEGGRRR